MSTSLSWLISSGERPVALNTTLILINLHMRLSPFILGPSMGEPMTRYFCNIYNILMCAPRACVYVCMEIRYSSVRFAFQSGRLFYLLLCPCAHMYNNMCLCERRAAAPLYLNLCMFELTKQANGHSVVEIAVAVAVIIDGWRARTMHRINWLFELQTCTHSHRSRSKNFLSICISFHECLLLLREPTSKRFKIKIVSLHVFFRESPITQ